jgi:chorismate-pyruvate lyase
MAHPVHLHAAPRDSERHSDAPVWRTAREPGALPASVSLAGWLTHEGSLTRRLRGCDAGPFEFEVVGEGWEPAPVDDRRRLGVDDADLYVRRVRMNVAGRPRISACTMAPAATVTRHPWLTGLGTTPLWEALAAQGDITRTDFEYAAIEAPAARPSLALRGLVEAGPGCWGRRSRFFVGDAPLLVYEFFLPALGEIKSA